MVMNTDKNSVQKEYTQLAENYDKRWHFYIETTIQETLTKIELTSGDHLLDIGCGTGALLAAIEKKYPGVALAGIDPTRKMLDIANKRLPNKVHIEQSWAEKLPFATETFNIVVSCNMFHYIREPMNALSEISRVLKPNGKIIVTDWCNDYMTNQLNDIFLRILGFNQ